MPGQFDLGDFTSLPYADNQFDIAFERAALSQTQNFSTRAVAEISRVLRPGALFYAELYSDRVTSRGTKTEDGLMIDVEGPYSGLDKLILFKK